MGNRIGSIDIFRGFCIFLMLLGHLGIWWMSDADFPLFHLIIWVPLEPVAKGTGFILVSGASIALSFSKKKIDFHDSYKEDTRVLRNTSYIRAVILFLVAFIINFCMVFIYPEAKIFDWWILFTLSVCLLFSWPLMKLNIRQRMLLGIALLAFNFFFYQILITYESLSPISSFFIEFFYPTDTRQNPILSFFPFFLFGTVLGSYLGRIDFEKTENFHEFFKRISLPLILVSIGALIFGILFQFPSFLKTNSFSYIIYALGLNTLIISVLITTEKITKINFNSKYNPLFYFSYYSLTVYLLHYVLMLFAGFAFSFWMFWLVFSILIITLTIFLHIMYRTVAGLFSLKYFVSLAGEYFSLKIEESYYSKKKYAFENLIAKLKINILSKN